MSNKEDKDTLMPGHKLVADDGSGVEIAYKGPKNKDGKYSMLSLPGTQKWQKDKKAEPGTDKWFKAWKTLPYLTKGRKNHYMLPVKEKMEILMHNIDLLEKWSQKYKKSINCNNPKGFSQKAHCAGKKK
mgnify:CR=1 FL=1